MRIRYECQAGGTKTAACIPTSDWEGFRGMVHGGIVSIMLDEATSKAVTAAGHEALTGELRDAAVAGGALSRPRESRRIEVLEERALTGRGFGFPTTSMRAPSVEPLVSARSEVLKPGVNGVPTSEVALSKDGEIIVGKFVDRDRPDYLELMRGQMLEQLTDRYVEAEHPR